MNDDNILKQQQRDVNLREALVRREAKRPAMPTDLNRRVMTRMAKDGRRGHSVRRCVAAAACVLVLSGIGVTVMMERKNGDNVAEVKEVAEVKDAKDVAEVAPPPPSTASEGNKGANPSLKRLKKREANPSSTREENQEVMVTSPNPSSKRDSEPYEGEVKSPTEGYFVSKGDGGYARYASATKSDSVVYQAPGKMDEFIAKMAANNGVSRVALECSQVSNDSTVVSTAYVFPEDSDVDVFGRLLQMACWYNSKTSGYLLSFSRQQFFFCLNDVRRGEKYLWTAERISGNRILVYSTHSPLETAVSSTCYQEYKKSLNIKILKN